MLLASSFVSMMSWRRPRRRLLAERVACRQEWVVCQEWAECLPGCSKPPNPEIFFYLIFDNNRFSRTGDVHGRLYSITRPDRNDCIRRTRIAV
jgi:hypothetical protein